MKFQIAVVQNGKKLFDIDMTTLRKVEDITRVFTLLTNRFPASEGFYPIITVVTYEYKFMNQDIVDEALQNGTLTDYLKKEKKTYENGEHLMMTFYNYYVKHAHLR